MIIIAYVPSPVLDEFWIGCSKEEAEKWFVPLLDEKRLEQYNVVLRMNADRREHDAHWATEYDDMIKEALGVNEVSYIYFGVTRDLSNCYAEVAHYPFHQLWNGESPFCLCDHVVIDSPEQLKDIVITYKGKPFDVANGAV